MYSIFCILKKQTYASRTRLRSYLPYAARISPYKLF